MEFPNIRAAKQKADESLAKGRKPKQVLLYYLGISTLVSLLVALADYYLATQLAKSSGLQMVNNRSILQTVMSILPIVQLFVTLGLGYGYLHAMMRISRGTYADQNDLKTGFRYIGPIFRCALLQGLIYLAVALVSYFVVTTAMNLSPWGSNLTESLGRMMDAIEAGTVYRFDTVVLVMIILYAVLSFGVCVPIMYRFRMVNYVLLDYPRSGARYALRASTEIMQGNCLKLFMLDLSFWWYDVLLILATVIGSGDQILSLLGVRLPFQPAMASFVFFGVYLVLEFIILYFLRNKVELTYIHTYDTLVEKPETEGIILGNIFEM